MNAPFSQIDLTEPKEKRVRATAFRSGCLLENEKPKAIWPLLTLAVGRQQTVGKMTQIIYSHKDPPFLFGPCKAQGLHVKKDAVK